MHSPDFLAWQDPDHTVIHHVAQVRVEEELAFLPGSSLFAHICQGKLVKFVCENAVVGCQDQIIGDSKKPLEQHAGRTGSEGTPGHACMSGLSAFLEAHSALALDRTHRSAEVLLSSQPQLLAISGACLDSA